MEPKKELRWKGQARPRFMAVLGQRLSRSRTARRPGGLGQYAEAARGSCWDSRRAAHRYKQNCEAVELGLLTAFLWNLDS